MLFPPQPFRWTRCASFLSAPVPQTSQFYHQLAPLSCTGRGPNWHNPYVIVLFFVESGSPDAHRRGYCRADIASNDVAGNFSVTLVDALDTFVVLNDTHGFETAVRNIIQWVSFDVNTKPQVFETTIRVLGGLLSGHIFANKTEQPFHLPWYRGELLDLAYDLGLRLLPAFSTPTGMPFARVRSHDMSHWSSFDVNTDKSAPRSP